MRAAQIGTRRVLQASESVSVAQAAVLMSKHQTGCLVIVREEDGRTVPVGIVTDRDLVIRALAGQLDPASSALGAVMSAPLLCCYHDCTIDEVVLSMHDAGVRRLPVVDDSGALVGIISADDVLVALHAMVGQVTETLLVEPALDRAYL